MKYYTVGTVRVPELTLRLAKHLLTLPEGSWPETQEAQAGLSDALPSGLGLETIIEFAARHARHVHVSRIDWLRGLGRCYSMADQAKVYLALDSCDSGSWRQRPVRSN